MSLAAEHLIRVAAIVLGVWFAIVGWVDWTEKRIAPHRHKRVEVVFDLVWALVFTTIAAIGVVGWAR